jgi:hypothetical protein
MRLLNSLDAGSGAGMTTNSQLQGKRKRELLRAWFPGVTSGNGFDCASGNPPGASRV